MGIKKMFKKKEPTEQELIEDLQRVGISTKSNSGRQEKFGTFKHYAHERHSQRSNLAPVNPYADMGDSSHNPYVTQATRRIAHDGSLPKNESERVNHYGEMASRSNRESEKLPGNANDFNPYPSRNKAADTEYSRVESLPHAANPYDFSVRVVGSERIHTVPKHGSHTAVNAGQHAMPSSKKSDSYVLRDDELSLDLNDIPTSPAVQMKRPLHKASGSVNDALNLNDLPDEDLNVDVDEFLSDQVQVSAEDEEVEAIKQDIRFTKQESVALTRNTLRMAQEAEASGINTLGMLGSQSERLYNAEQNLLLADTQTKIADEKVRELGRLNRSIFIPAAGNPFNKKSRLRQQELKLKADKLQEKYLRDTNRQEMYASEQRLTQGITGKTPNSELFNKYQGEKQIQQAQRYRFESDSEDDEMEKELASNLDLISDYSNKLKSTANIMSQEVDAQNDRLRRIEEDADKLDINVHLNSSRLNNIR